ncbi:hypothetical protein GO496_00455 [Acidovorax citrulli]|nr:hypothetical protein [Paracidovorax citrulli]
MAGDIVNSGVTFSGPPATAFTGNSYALFKAENASRAPVVFAGANDGMLHAFAAKTDPGNGITAGDELFAYIPSWMGPKLSALTAPTYVNNHQAYVDAPSAVGEAQVAFTAGAGSRSDWKTVLVSGTGAGGRGVFALDVSKPESFAVGNAMWGVHRGRRRGYGLRGRASADPEIPDRRRYLPLVCSGGQRCGQLHQHIRQRRGWRPSCVVPAGTGQGNRRCLGGRDQLLQVDFPCGHESGGHRGHRHGELHSTLRPWRRSDTDLCW